MCEELGADALGFVHIPGRNRSRSLAEIADMCSAVGPMTPTFLICSPSSRDEAVSMLEQSRARGLQLYSLEPRDASELRSQGIPVLRVIPPDPIETRRYAESVDAIVFENGPPGTGCSYDYSRLPIGDCLRAIIAGGLNASTLESAKRLEPYGLDVSSGVERVRGRKDRALVQDFIRRARA